MPGRHNLLNALGAVAVGLEVGVPFARIAAALEEFRGAERRFQLRGEARGVMVVDDYGHHPTEIAAVIAAARAGHRSARRRRVPAAPLLRARAICSTSSATRSARADEVVLTDIYAAGEAPIPGVTVEALAEAVVRETGRPVHVVKSARRRARRGGGARAAERSGDHARRRIDRHASPIASSRRCERRQPARRQRATR